MTLAQNMMVSVHIYKPFLFWLPHTAELCLYWSRYLRIPFWPCSLLNILSNFPLFVLYRKLVLAVTVLLLLVLLLARSTITCSLVSEAMFINEKVLMRTRKLFSIPGWSFSLTFENRAENSSPGVNSALG